MPYLRINNIRINKSLLCLFLSCAFIGNSSASEFNSNSDGSFDESINGSFDSSTDLFQSAPVFLPVDEAFRLSASRDDGVVKLYWQIQPGYYLYKHKLKVSVANMPKNLKMAAGKKKHDEFFGNVEVFYQELDVEVGDVDQNVEKIELQVEFQGCADAGICYPPRKLAIST